MHAYPVKKLVNLLDPTANVLFGTSQQAAEAAIASGDAEQVRKIGGQFAIVQQVGHLVRMARSIGRPMRYFLAKQTDGPLLVVAERMDEIKNHLESLGLADQFHPSYTRMVPAHYVLDLALVGFPDPSPQCTRYFTPQRNSLPADLETIGRSYIGAV